MYKVVERPHDMAEVEVTKEDTEDRRWNGGSSDLYMLKYVGLLELVEGQIVLGHFPEN